MPDRDRTESRRGPDGTEQMERWKQYRFENPAFAKEVERQTVRVPGDQWEKLLENRRGLTGDTLVREWLSGSNGMER